MFLLVKIHNQALDFNQGIEMNQRSDVGLFPTLEAIKRYATTIINNTCTYLVLKDDKVWAGYAVQSGVISSSFENNQAYFDFVANVQKTLELRANIRENRFLV